MSYVDVRPLRSTLAELRLHKLEIGPDARNRTLLYPFRSKTGRNAPSSSKFIFGPAKWTRRLIRPMPGTGLAYVDFVQQELGIAAALSGDAALQHAYTSGDAYLAFAKQGGAAPADATKHTHPDVRALFKATALAVQYGMGEDSLAIRIRKAPIDARHLLLMHRRLYPRFWRWSDAAIDTAQLARRISTVFGWPLHVSAETTERTLRNWPMQSNGAEMLRLALCYCTEAGIAVCAPAHDAILIEASLSELADAARTTAAYMVKASRDVLRGFELRTECATTIYPNRFGGDGVEKTWDIVASALADFGVETVAAG